jgi:hypothetical protein
MPTLLRTRPLPLQLVLAVIVPIAFGAICGWLLGVNEVAYLIASVLAIAGGYVAGQEHMGAVEGAIRGLVGGALFGGAILLVHDATGETAKAKLPHPEILLVAITVVAGIVLGALGGRRRAKREEEDEEEEEGTGFDLTRVFGAAVLAFSLFFLPWFSTSCTSAHRVNGNVVGSPTRCNPNSKLELANKLKNGDPHYVYGSYTGWEVYRFMRWALLAACIAPFLLAYIIARGHELSWRTGEVTMIVGILAFALILVDGIILGRPGSNKGFGVDIDLEYGYLVGLIGAFLISLGGFRRQAENVKPQPPGI